MKKGQKYQGNEYNGDEKSRCRLQYILNAYSLHWKVMDVLQVCTDSCD